MKYDFHNPTRAPQVFYDGLGTRRPHRVEAGETLGGIEVSAAVRLQLRNAGVFVITESKPDPLPMLTPAGIPKKPLIVIGMWGIGDNLHQRALLKHLIKAHDVWLETCHGELYWDLIDQGLKLDFRSTRLRAQAKTIERERGLFNFPPPPPNAPKIKLWYQKPEIDKAGSIAEAMFLPFGLHQTEPDFSMPVKPEWRAAAKKLIDGWGCEKPIMIFRPIVLRREWDGAARNPDPDAYSQIFQAIRDRFFVVSVADLQPGEEWVVGPELGADVKLHKGELDFPTMAGLWAEADMFFGAAGFGPVLAQAVGLPALIVYGGRESYRTTERAGAHLSPTLGIDPINPCDCHSHHHKCDKRIDVPVAIERARRFVDFLEAEASGIFKLYRSRPVPAPPVAAPVLLNFGCGDNHLPGWRNMDIEVNIEQPLPFADACADAIFSEHCVEHTSQYKAVAFFKEAFRVLKPGGLVRITVPSLEQIIDGSAADYHRFASKWSKLGPSLEGAMDAIVNAHGHQTIWTASALRVCLFYAGFRDLKQQKPGVSDYEGLRGIEGHGRVIGDKFNEIESLTFEARKPGDGREAYKPPQADAADQAAATGGAARADHGESLRRAAQPAQERRRTLIFATTYVDSEARQELTGYWLKLHTALNPDCDFLIVDSASPRPLTREGRPELPNLTIFDFGDNVGHLSRSGRDGWGRAFCKGLDYAVEHGYDYAIHIEGDSLCRAPARDMVAMLREAGKFVGTIPVLGTTRPVSGWVETGLMVFEVDYLRRSGFTAKYDWPNRRETPTPETVIYRMLSGQVATLPLKGQRNDKDEITHKNVLSFGLDWITHCHRDVWAYREFTEAALKSTETAADGNVDPGVPVAPIRVAVVVGGGAGVAGELSDTDDLLFGDDAPLQDVSASYFVINDMIPRFQGPCQAVSLHPNKLADWLKARAEAGYPSPVKVWSHVKHQHYPDVTDARDDWRGSSGLFAVAVARQLGFDRIILCGVPMSADAGHIVRGKEPWKARDQFVAGWVRHKDEFAPCVRSWSGWTAEQYGKPDRNFLIEGLK